MRECVVVWREWVVEGGLDGYFEEQGLPAGIQECLERFHRRCVDNKKITNLKAQKFLHGKNEDRTMLGHIKG